MASVHEECGFVLGSVACLLHHRGEVTAGDWTPEAVLVKAVNRANVSDWQGAHALAALAQALVMADDAAGVLEDVEAQVAEFVAQVEADETRAASKLAEVEAVLAAAKRGSGARHPAILQALDVISRGQA